MWLRQVFPASHLALQESKKSKRAKTTKGTSGPRRSNVFAMFDLDTRSWKTSQVCLIAATSPKFSGRWPKQGSMQDGLCSEQTMWVRRTEESDSGYWPTPSATPRGPHTGAQSGSVDAKGRISAKGVRWGATLETAVKMWPTPTAATNGPGKNPNNPRGIHQGNALATAARTNSTGGQLNPSPFVEWLMGWPIGWTAYDVLETARFQEWLQQHGEF